MRGEGRQHFVTAVAGRARLRKAARRSSAIFCQTSFYPSRFFLPRNAAGLRVTKRWRAERSVERTVQLCLETHTPRICSGAPLGAHGWEEGSNVWSLPWPRGRAFESRNAELGDFSASRLFAQSDVYARGLRSLPRAVSLRAVSSPSRARRRGVPWTRGSRRPCWRGERWCP